MGKQEIIQRLTELGVAFNPNAKPATLQKLLDDATGDTVTNSAPSEYSPLPETPTDTPSTENSNYRLMNIMGMLEKVADSVSTLNERIAKLEGKPTNEHMRDATSSDIERAKEANSGIDARIRKIVADMLGEDFEIEMESYEDRPGFLFTVIVPERLSDFKKDFRPVLAENGEYKRDERGSVVMEEYYPQDRRSCSLGSADSFTAIRDHCERVRANIVAFYQKMNKPAPEFKYAV